MNLQVVNSIVLPNRTLAMYSTKADAHRKLVNIALNKSLEPIKPEKSELITLNLKLHDSVIEKIMKVARDNGGLPFADTFAALANAGIHYLEGIYARDTIIQGQVAEKLDSMLLLNETDEKRDEQQRFWRYLAGGLALNKVVMAEGSTGVGKGRAIVSAAIMCAKAGKIPVVIAAPTIKVLSQLFEREFLSCEAARRAGKGLKVAFLPGKQEFVDEEKLKAFLEDNPIPAVQQWFDAGGPNREATALSVAAGYAGIKLSWLMADLRAVAGPELRPEDFSLGNEGDSRGKHQLQEIREYAAAADIVFCTHAMLARIAMSYWNLLPSLKAPEPESDEKPRNPVLLIDEAHLMEEAMAEATSDDLSLFSLRFRIAREMKNAKKGAGSAFAKAIKKINGLMQLCQESSIDERMVLRPGKCWVPENTDWHLNDRLAEAVRDVASIIEKKRNYGMDGVVDIDADRIAIKAVLNALEGKSDNRLTLSFSPERRFPSFQVGKSDVGSDLKRLWAHAAGGVGLISATLWLPSWDNELRTDYISGILSLPAARVEARKPVIWKEIYEAPTRYLPSKELAADLIPPEDPDPDKLDTWCAAQATAIAAFNKDCKGGTLVLCTSYAQVEALSQGLIDERIDPQRLVLNSGRLIDDQMKFTALHRERKRPLWLALGPAWTGVDLVEKDENGNDAPAKDDRLLSDLIITRIPIGLTRSVTMEARVASNFKVTGYETLLRFKQGLGRLIRRKGLCDRRLLLLDGRLTCDGALLKSQFMRELVRDVRKLIEDYAKRKTISA